MAKQLQKHLLAQWREEKGLTLNEAYRGLVRAGLDVSSTTLRNWENEKDNSFPGAEFLPIIADFYKKNVNDFYK